MFKSINTILFATDLTEKMKPAFDFAAALATRYQATIILLHVFEKIPDYVEGRLRGLFGEPEYAKIAEDHEKSVRQTLIAKKSSDSLIQAALEQFCSEAGIDDDSCGYHAREVIIRNGHVVDEIIGQSEKYACDIIIMGSRKGLLKKAAIGSVIKEVLRRATTPVLVVPPAK
jgi:nucleotide-binding universal stress UspA family protein